MTVSTGDVDPAKVDWSVARGAGVAARSSGVRRYAAWRDETDEPVARWEVPTGGVSLVLSFGASLRVSNASGTEASTVSSFVVGMYDEPALTQHDGEALGVQVDLSPSAAFALLRAPMDELRNRVVPIRELSSLSVDALVERMLELTDWDARFNVLDEELRRVITTGPRMSPEVAWIDTQLRRQPSARVSALAEEVGWGRTRVVERFRREVGLPPKTVARIVRFRRAVARLKSRTPPSFAAVAADCGYADQAHFNRDFRHFAGCTPSEFLRGEIQAVS